MSQTDFAVPSILGGNISGVSSDFSFRKMLSALRRFFRKTILLPFIVVVLLFLVFAGFLMKDTVLKNINFSSDKTSLKPPVATETINKSFSFPIIDQSGDKVGAVKYELQNAELREEIVIRGQKATVVNGKKFLVFNLKLTNTYNKAIQINARDFIRLSVNKSNEKLAPDIHNDPVEVQALSTKYTRVGFPVENTAKDLVINIGEINGKKQLIKLNIQ